MNLLPAARLRLTRAGNHCKCNPREARDMLKIVSGTFAAAVGALVLATASAAATYTVAIRSTGFSPASLTVNHGDKVTFRNLDKVDHQVVADNGSFASP